MKKTIATFLMTLLLGISCGLVIAQSNYNLKPKTVIPSEHTWVFTDREVGKILVQYLKSLGTNVPDGRIRLAGLETHFDFGNNPRIEMTITERTP